MGSTPASRTTGGAATIRGTSGVAVWIDRLTLAGILAPAGFFVVMTVLGLVTPGYNALARYGSELSLGRLGWIMIANFVVLGLAELALATALGHTIAGRASGWISTGAVGLIGAALVVAGVCVTDPAKPAPGAHTWHGVVHALMAVIIFFIATPIAGLATARRFRDQAGFARCCVLTAVAAPALLVVTFVSGNLVGLTERIAIAVLLAWLTTLAVQIRRRNPAEH